VRKLILVLILLMLPGVSASTFVGWANLGESVSYGDNAIVVRDVGVDGEVLIALSTPSGVSYLSLKPGEEEKVGDVKVKVEKVFLGENPMVYLNVTFPPALINQSIKVGRYVIRVKDVTVDSFEVTVSNGTGEKVYKDSFEVGGYKVVITPRPEIFSGELKLLDNVTYGDYKITLSGLNMTVVNNKSSSILDVKFEGKDYWVEEGKYAYVGPFIVKYNGFRCEMKGNLCDPVISLAVLLRGVNVSIAYDPSKVFWLYEGKGFTVGPLIVKLEGLADGVSYIVISNNCGDELYSGTLRANPTVVDSIEYDGIKLGLLETDEDKNGKKGLFIAFYNESEKPRYLAYLNVTVKAPERVTLLSPFKVRVSVMNEGNSRVMGMLAKFNPGDGVKVIGRDSVYISSLDPGKSVELSFTLLPTKEGKVNVGKVTVEGPVPYPLACGGLSMLKFSSNSPVVEVEPLNIGVNISYPVSVSLGVPFEVNVTLSHNIEGNLTLNLPPGIGLLSEGRVSAGSVVLPARNASIKLVAVTPGNYTVPVTLASHGVKLYNSTISFEVQGENEAPAVAVTTITKVITKTEEKVSEKTITVSKNETITKTITMTKTMVKTSEITKTVVGKGRELLMFILGVILGIGIIILVAWIKARSS